jgi:hypothetical protein
MNLAEARVVLRPRSLAEILDLALRFATGPAATLYAKLATLILLPAWVLCIALHWAAGWPWWQVWLLALALATPIQGVFTLAVGKLMFAEHVTVRELMREYLRRFPAYLGALLITRVQIAAVCALGVFLILPPLWIWGRGIHVHEACLLERAGPIDAVRRAARMVENRVVPAGATLLLLSIVAVGFVGVSEALLNHGLFDFVLQIGKPFGSLIDEGGSAPALLGLLLAVPYWATARFLLYVDLRTRRDGWDVQVRFMALANQAEPEAAQ